MSLSHKTGSRTIVIGSWFESNAISSSARAICLSRSVPATGAGFVTGGSSAVGAGGAATGAAMADASALPLPFETETNSALTDPPLRAF